MIELTFLSAASGKPLVKKFTPTEKFSYPNVKTFNSEVVQCIPTFDGLQHFTEILKEKAAAGSCLLKGPLLHPLVEQPRKGAHDRDAQTRLLVLDIDDAQVDFDIPEILDKDAIRQIDQRLMARLPRVFGATTHVIQASASLGMKRKTLSLHVYYFLDEPVHPRILKDYLTGLNFDNGFFQNQLKLNATGLTLSYKIDRTLADNSRLIYIGTPEFQGVTNPFPNPDDRIVFIPSDATLFPSEEILHTSSASVSTAQLRKINELRQLGGLTKKQRIKLTSIVVDGERIPLLADPEKARLLLAGDDGEFVRYNLNGGDSNAYWVFKHSPEIVHNFKGEPAFRFSDVDPEGYEEHKRRFSEISPDEPDYSVSPFAFIDWFSQPHWGLIDSSGQIVRLEPCKREAIRDLYAQYMLSAPENLPVYEYAFKPQDDREFDREGLFINKYRKPDMMKALPEVPEEYQGHTLGYFQAAKDLFPTIYNLLYSVCGGTPGGKIGILEMEHFINWLAYILQNKRKTGIAWVMHGTQGTGKGLLFHKVLTPLFGKRHSLMKRTQDIEDSFNDYIEHSLLIAVDEFRSDDAVKNGMVAKLKNMVSEEIGSVRKMRVDQYTAELFTNFLFFSNDRDAMRMTGDDRRFSIAPRQEAPILKQFPNIVDELEENLPTELPMFAAYLMQFDVDEQAAKTPLMNDAKAAMREASASSVDQFVEALANGNLDYFLQVLYEEPRMYGEDYVGAAQNIVKAIIRSFEPATVTKMWLTDIRPLYNVLIGRMDNTQKLGKLLNHHNLPTRYLRKGEIVRSGIEVAWNLALHDIDYLRETFLEPDEHKVPATNPHKPYAVH